MKTVFLIVNSLILLSILTFSSCTSDETKELEPVQQLPVITSFEPTHGSVSSLVSISCENLEIIDTDNIVKFDGIQAKVLESRHYGTLRVEVPVGVKQGMITVETTAGSTMADSTFTLDIHSISSIIRVIQNKPGTELAEFSGPGERLVLTGENFSRYATDNIVRINGVECEVKSILDENYHDHDDPYKELSFVIPQGAQTGTITLTIGEHTVESAQTVNIPSGYWERLASTFPGSDRWETYSFTIGDKAYVGGGYINTSSGKQYPVDFWEYNPQTDQWTKIADLPVGRAKALTFSVNGKGYICSGILYGESTFEDLKDLWEYDPVTNKWTQKAEMPASHTMGIGFTIDKRAFVGLGDSKTIWEYLPDTDSWEYVCAYPGTFLLNGISLVIDGVAYIGMGWNGLGQAVNEFWAYDVTSNEWTQKKDFPGIVRFQPLSYSVNGKGYYGAGHEAFDVWKYNPADNTWEQTVPINTKWIGSTYCFSINGKGYVGSTLESGAPYDDFTSLLRYNE